MGQTTHDTEASEASSNSYRASGAGLREWQTVLRNKVTGIRDQQKRGESSWWPGSSPTAFEKELTEAVIARCGSLIAFANPDQCPADFASTFADVQATKKTLRGTEGYGGLANQERWGLDNAEKAIEFGAMAHLCASLHGLGAPISYNAETVALAHSFFDVGSDIPGVCQLITLKAKLDS
jgi:hypothetical protein